MPGHVRVKSPSEQMLVVICVCGQSMMFAVTVHDVCVKSQSEHVKIVTCFGRVTVHDVYIKARPQHVQLVTCDCSP